MKKTICALCLMLSLVPLFLLAQNQNTTFKRDFGYRFDNGLTVDVQMSAPGYYDENDHEILNGQFQANGKETYSTRGMNGTFTYSASGTYAENKLHGNLNIKLSQVYSGSQKGTLNQELKASYQNGIPTGTWTWTETAVQNGKTESETTSITFNEAKLSSIKRTDGNYYIINKDGSITCKWRNESYINGINTKSYYRKTGAEVDMDDEVLNLINQYAEGKITKGDLVEKGYGLKDAWTALLKDVIEWINNQLTYGESGTGSLSFEIGSSILYYDENFSLHKYIGSNVKFSPYALQRVSMSSEEVVMSAVKEWSNTENIETLLTIQGMVNDNHFRNEFYFSDNVKNKVLEHLNVQLENIVRLHTRREHLRQSIDSTLERIYSEYPNQREYRSLTRSFMSNYDYEKDTLKLREYYEKAVLIYNTCFDLTTLSNAMDSTLKLLNIENPILYKEYDALTDTYYSVNNCTNKEELESYYRILQQWLQDVERCHNVHRMSSKIDENSNKINAIIAAYASASTKNYNTYITTSLRSIQKNMLNNSDAMLSIIKQQENCLQYIEELSKIDSNSNVILSCEYSDILKAYQSYLKTLNLAWTADASLQTLLDVQQVQDGCIKFIAERKNIDNNTVAITEDCANYKDILKAYQSYLKTLNLAWMADASIQTLLDVQSVQKTFIKAISREDVSDVNTKIKKNKDKSLEGITRILEE